MAKQYETRLVVGDTLSDCQELIGKLTDYGWQTVGPLGFGTWDNKQAYMQSMAIDVEMASQDRVYATAVGIAAAIMLSACAVAAFFV